MNNIVNIILIMICIGALSMFLCYILNMNVRKLHSYTREIVSDRLRNRISESYIISEGG